MIQCRHADQAEFMLKSTPRVKPTGAQGACKLTLRDLFESEETPLLRYAFSLTGRRAVAEEIVQEVFLHLHAHFEEVDAPKAWLMRSVRNRAFNHLRDNKREQIQGDGHALGKAESIESPEDFLMRMEAAGVLRQLLQDLEVVDRRLVTLKYFEGRKYSEISEETGLSISNVGYRLHHILKELAGKLKPLGIDGKS